MRDMFRPGPGCVQWILSRLAALAVALTAPVGVSALAAEKRIPAVFTAEPPVLDGRLDDPVWDRAAVVDDLHMVVPDEYAPPSERSVIRVLYGPDALYFAARFYDSEPDRVSARVMRQGDFSWGEDGFSVILDPHNQGRSGYIFDINPNGVRSQGLFTNVTEENWQWQAIWQGAARRDELGWTAEVAIPFDTLAFDPDNETWGINFIRWLGRRNERFGWVSHNRELNPANSGALEGLSGIEPGIGLDVVPGIRMAYVDDKTTAETESFIEPSLDVFYKVTPTLTAALTFNTDFSGTTADARQVNLTRFDLFFPEQRKFFLQDADIFEFGRIGRENGRPFFSRRIGLGADGEALDIDAGGKLTGRAGPVDIGVLAVRQEASGAADTADLFVARLAANVLSESSLGVIATHGNPAASVDNRLVGIDFRYLNTRMSRDRTLVGALWYQRSDTAGIDGDESAFGFDFAVPARQGWQARLAVKEIQQNYNPALGFANRTGIRQYEAEIGHQWRPAGAWLRSVTSEVELWRVDGIDSGLESEDLRIGLFELENQAADYLTADYHLRRERLFAPFEIAAGVVIPAGNYAFETACLGVRSGQHRRLSAEVGGCDGDFYDGSRTEANVDLVWRPDRHLRIGGGFEWNDIALANGSFITRVARLRADIAFTTTWYWENLVQYDNVSEVLGLNSILRWVPDAGREMVLVVNRAVEDFDGDNRFDPLYSDLRFKFGYTIRF